MLPGRDADASSMTQLSARTPGTYLGGLMLTRVAILLCKSKGRSSACVFGRTLWECGDTVRQKSDSQSAGCC